MTAGEHIIFNRTRFQVQDVTHAMVENGGYLGHWCPSYWRQQWRMGVVQMQFPGRNGRAILSSGQALRLRHSQK